MAEPALRFSRINHVGITTTDLDASVDWWVQHLGAERLYAYDLPGGRAAFVTLGDFRIEFFAWDDPAPMDPARREVMGNARTGGVNHVGLEVADMDAMLAALRARGVEIAQEPGETPNSGGERYAFFRDNIGVLVELYEPRAGAAR